jgi:hypothetical protein
MNHLHNAIRKCSHEYKWTWSGYLIPKEILTLRDFGVHFHERDIEIAVDWKRNGFNNGRWVFFTIDKNSTVEKEFKEIKDGIRRT